MTWPLSASSLNTACLRELLRRSVSMTLDQYVEPVYRRAGTERALGQDPDALFDLRAIFQEPYQDIELHALPALLHPQKDRHGLHNLEKVFAPDPRSGQDIFALRDIDRRRGTLVVVRSDQYVAQFKGKQLNSTQVFGSTVDERRLRPAHRVRTVIGAV
ncbi:hypothetical protein FSY45_23505 [Comamonas sp. Z1]|jgi:hypothetical protein|nr:hypothetical protein KLP38_29945 [Cupriavidus sp. EM10]TYK71199.1 hypothetical protein FSY45_23505 [Comamonas sp. Z1]